MNSASQTGQTGFSGAAIYRITVRGRVPESWNDRLSGMKVSTINTSSEDGPQSVLEGLLRDQSELSGIFNTMFHLQLEIIRLEQVPGSSD